MGLDSVELLIDIENTFQITFTNTEAEKIATVGAMYEKILEKIDYDKHNKCNSQVMFYKFRQLLSYHCKINKNEITPKTKLQDLFNIITIKQKWKDIQNDLYFKIPDLQRSKILQTSLLVLTIFGGFTTLGLFSDLIIDSSIKHKVFSMLIILVLMILWLSSVPLKKHHKYETVGELIKGILPINIKILDLKIQNNEDVLDVLKFIIHDKMGIPIDEIQLHSHFVNDLRID
jgi:hypothetical protein